MGQFKDLTDATLQGLGARLIRNIKSRLLQQVPRPGYRTLRSGEKGPTGKLFGIIQQDNSYIWEKDQNGNWSFSLDLGNSDYGKYTMFGTRPYSNNWRSDLSLGFFGRPFIGYQRGIKGIKPQYWYSLEGDQPVYEAIIDGELRITWQEFLNNSLINIINNDSI